MRRPLLMALFWLLSAVAFPVFASNPSEEWKGYRIARITSNGKSPQERVQIWSEYLAKYPNGPYRERALEELEAASAEVWGAPVPLRKNYDTPLAVAPQSNCLPDTDLDAALGVESAPAPVPALIPPSDTLRYPTPSTKKPLRAGMLSLGAVVGGSMLAGSLLSSNEDTSQIAGGALLATSLLAGPSVGHLYAGDKQHAKKMIVARAFFAAFGVGALLWADSNTPVCIDFCEPVPGLGGAYALGAIGLSASYGLFFYDLVDSFFVVQRTQGKPVKNRFKYPAVPAKY